MEPNYYAGGGHVNRLSWMRQSTAFLRAAAVHPRTRYLLFSSLDPLVLHPPNAPTDYSVDGSAVLATLPYAVVSKYLPSSGAPERVVGDEGTLWPEQLEGRKKETEHLALDGYPMLVFLGADEGGVGERSLPTKPSSGEFTKLEDYTSGTPLWALDVSSIPGLSDLSSVTALFHATHSSLPPNSAQSSPHPSHASSPNASPPNEEDRPSLDFTDMRAGMLSLASREAAVAGQARALLDWNRRNRYCPGCGRATYAVWGGWKRACVPELHGDGQEGGGNGERPPCVSKKGVHNFSYPRTDPVCIMAILHPSEDSILLGRQKTWPKGFYSCLAGFLEPGESLEDAVRREVLEESGVRVEGVRYHSTQPWPYPGSLMIGAMGVAAHGQQIRTDLDNELEDARFFSRSAVLRALDSKQQSSLTRQEIDRIEGGRPPSPTSPSSKSEEEIKIRLPPRTAIAHRLIESWARRSAGWEGSGVEQLSKM